MVTFSAIKALLLADGVSPTTIDIFLKWHQQNPAVWKAFESTALEAINAGFKRWGAKGIAEIVRWRLSLETKSDFKLNNNFVAYYARVFALKYPQHADFFEFREARGLKEAA